MASPPSLEPARHLARWPRIVVWTLSLGVLAVGSFPMARAESPPSERGATRAGGVVSRRAAGALPGRARGVALGLFSEDAGWSYRPLLEEIAATGADHVELVVAWYQKHGGSTELYEHPRYTAPPEAVRAAIRAARAVGLRVLVFPIVRLLQPRSPDDWRGTLRPSDRAAWFASYRARLLALARLAAREGAEAISIGSELSTLDGQDGGDRARWVALVGELRRSFPGSLTYSGNWDHFREVGIYDLVDSMGVTGYFSLVPPERADSAQVTELVEAWKPLRAALLEAARRVGRPLLFTELGYRSQRGAAATPWDEGSTTPVDLEGQRRLYEAFGRAWADAPPALFEGVYCWNWYGWGGARSRGYTPRGKPALKELRRWFARPAKAAGPSLASPR